MMWKVIKEFPDYIINEYGIIYKIHEKKCNKIMKPKIDKDGYLHIGLRNDNGRFFRRTHRLVAETFIANDNINNNEVNHIDGNRQNNHFSNLEWCDAQYNINHSFQVLGRKGTHSTDIQCKLYKDNVLLGEFDNIKNACKFAEINYGASYSSLYKYKKCKGFKIIEC